jgi:death-on-curing protein
MGLRYQHRDTGLAAAYAFGLVRNHPFRDGNKRVGLVTMAVFLAINGYTLTADDDTVVKMVVHLADGRMSERKLTSWIERNIKRRRR